MTKKPGLFSRLKSSISSSLNDAVDSLSDPGQEIALMLDDLDAQIKKSELDLKQAMVDRKVMERKVADLEKDVAGWQGRAEQALKLGDEALARAALKRKSDHNERLIDLKTALAEQNALVDQMMGHVRESKNRLKALNLRRSSLMAQARAAKRGLAPGQISDGGTGQRMNDIENRIAEIEALNEVHAELHGDTVEEAAMDAKLAALSGDTEVDDALAELKAKLNAEQKSLPSKDD